MATTKNRAVVRRFAGHLAAAVRLRGTVVDTTATAARLGLVGRADGGVDGYITATAVKQLAASHA